MTIPHPLCWSGAGGRYPFVCDYNQLERSEKPLLGRSQTLTHFPGGGPGFYRGLPPTCARDLLGSRRPEWDARDLTPRLLTGGTGGGQPGWRLGRMEPPSRLLGPPRRGGRRARAGAEVARGQRQRRRCPGPGAAERARRARPRGCPRLARPPLPDSRGARRSRPRGPDA